MLTVSLSVQVTGLGQVGAGTGSPGSGVAGAWLSSSAVLNLWLCLEAMAEHELINPILQMGKPRLSGGQWLGLGCELGFAIRPSPQQGRLFPLGRGPTSWGMFLLCPAQPQCSPLPCRERVELRAYCVLPCARHVVCLLNLVHGAALGGSFPAPTLWMTLGDVRY